MKDKECNKCDCEWGCCERCGKELCSQVSRKGIILYCGDEECIDPDGEIDDLPF